MELKKAMEIQKKIEVLEGQLDLLRTASQVTPARLDGLPHAKSLESRVEIFAQKIVDTENELERLRAELYVVGQTLAIEIVSKLHGKRAECLVRRYALCQSFKNIAAEMRLSLVRAYSLHKEALQEYKALTND